MLNKTYENLEIYYNLNYDLLQNFELQKRNYQILSNLNNIKKNIQIKEIDEFIEDNDFNNKFKILFDIYKKILTDNEQMKIRNED